MRLRLILLAAAMASVASQASGQVFQKGSIVPQHFSMWATNNSVMDAGTAAKMPQGLQPFELGMVMKPNTTGNPFPAVATGTGPNGDNFCLYDSPVGIAGHYLCMTPNSGSNLASIDIGAVNGGAAGGLQFKINGSSFPFPGTGGGNVVGPSPAPTVGDIAVWNGGLTLVDGGLGTQAVANNTQLAAATTAQYPSGVRRLTFGNGNGAPGSDWVPETGTCASNGRVSDGGSCQDAAGGNSFYALITTPPDGRQWGATFNGTTDDTVPAQAMVAWSNAHNMPVSFPGTGGTLLISSTLNFTAEQTGFICSAGGADHHDVSPVPSEKGCWIKGSGSGAYLMTVIAPTGSTSNGDLDGIMIGTPGYLNFDGNNGAWQGALHVASIKNSLINATGKNFNAGEIFNIDVVHSTPGTFGEACDTQHNNFNLFVSNYGFTSKGVALHAWINPAISNGGCNPSGNYFNIVEGFGSSTGFFDEGGDNNTIHYQGFTTDNTQYCIDLSIRNDGGNLGPANSEHFLKYGCNGKGIMRGKTSFPTCVSGSTCVRDNLIDFMDVVNGTPYPGSEPGTTMASNDGFGIWWRGSSGQFSPQLAVAGLLTGGVGPGGQLQISGNQPNIAAGCTGLGSGGSCTLGSGSTDSNGTIGLNTGTGPATSGQVTMNFYSQFSGNVTNCVATPAALGSAWTSPFGVQMGSASPTNATFVWYAASMAASTSYGINYHCFGE